MLPHRKIKISRAPRAKKLKRKPSPSLYQRVLPIVVFLQDYKKYNPDDVLEILSFSLSSGNKALLDSVQKQELKDYLTNWNYSGDWLDD